jgi:hypothetical protein
MHFLFACFCLAYNVDQNSLGIETRDRCDVPRDFAQSTCETLREISQLDGSVNSYFRRIEEKCRKKKKIKGVGFLFGELDVATFLETALAETHTSAHE